MDGIGEGSNRDTGDFAKVHILSRCMSGVSLSHLMTGCVHVQGAMEVVLSTYMDSCFILFGYLTDLAVEFDAELFISPWWRRHGWSLNGNV